MELCSSPEQCREQHSAQGAGAASSPFEAEISCLSDAEVLHSHLWFCWTAALMIGRREMARTVLAATPSAPPDTGNRIFPSCAPAQPLVLVLNGWYLCPDTKEEQKLLGTRNVLNIVYRPNVNCILCHHYWKYTSSRCDPFPRYEMPMFCRILKFYPIPSYFKRKRLYINQRINKHCCD